jgi:hypothetical protein
MDIVTGTGRWGIEQSVGAFGGGALSGRVDVAHPDLGLCGLQLHGNLIEGNWLSVGRDVESSSEQSSSTQAGNRWPLELADAYVRGADLVAGYRPASDWPYSPQIYWRLGELDAVAGVVGSLSLLVSVQTHLLDTFPRIVVGSTVGSGDVIHLATGSGKQADSRPLSGDMEIQASSGVCCILRRPAGDAWSYAEFMPASDFRTVRAWREDIGNCRVEWRLFAEFLEKGVIRRARVHAAFLQRENDVDAAGACCKAIERESLPLTA